MIVDGKAIAAEVLSGVKERVATLGRKPVLAVLTCAPTFATENFLRIKAAKAKEAGIELSHVELPSESATEDVVNRLGAVDADGVVVQLPFPPHVSVDALLDALPANVDVDVIGREGNALFCAGESAVLPPVVGAIAEIAARYGISFQGKHVVVIGRGRLVGGPAALWAAGQGAHVTSADATTPNVGSVLEEADIIISGAGVPGLIKPAMVKNGVVIFDAGTSEEGGKLTGDADPSVASQAALFTPVPGGIGPITVAKLLENLVLLAERRGR